MNKGFTKISFLIGIIVALLIAFFLVSNVFATQQEQCNNVTEYPTKPSDFNDSRININYHDSDQQIDVTAHAGYAITEVALEVPDDGFAGFHVYATGPITNFNPPGSHDITGVKVKVKKVCVDPTPTISPEPTISPIPTIDPCQPVDNEVKVSRDIVNPCVTPSPSPEPTPIVECQFNCGGGGDKPTFAGSSTNAPVCTDGTTVQLPANPHVLRNGSKATVNFFITQGDSANVYYKEVHASNWEHSVSNVKPVKDNFVSVEIGGLDPKLGYTFGVQQKQGCGGGQLVTAVIVDGPQPKLFHFSYWEWSK